MSLYLITGGSGTGKSTLSLALKEHGYTAYDTDDDALARWQHNTTAYVHPKSSVKAHQRTPEFLSEHSWNVPRDVLSELDEPDKHVFVLGAMSNERVVADLFSHIFALYIDQETMKHRLLTRTNNDWGKQEHELTQSLAAHQGALERYKLFGYTVLDASKPIEEIITEIEHEITLNNG